MVGRPGRGRPPKRFRPDDPETESYAVDDGASDSDIDAPATPKRKKRVHVVYDTPMKAGVQTTDAYLRKMKLYTLPQVTQTSLFDFNGIQARTGWRLIARDDSSAYKQHARRIHNDPERIDRRGEHQKLRNDKLYETLNLVKNEYDASHITHDQLVNEPDLSIASQRLQQRFAEADYYRCIACMKERVDDRLAELRVDKANRWLDLRSEPKDWDTVLFSDEIRAGLGPMGKIRLTRKAGTRYDPKCIECKSAAREKDDKKVHAWAAAGYNFKSKMVFYDVPSNDNGKMTQDVYINHILEPVVKPWIGRYDFILEEDGDSGHGSSASNRADKWKRDNGLQTYFNIPGSPDLAPIENCWRMPKTRLKQVPHWDVETTKLLMREGWDQLRRESINRWVRSMPQRLKDVVKAHGQMTGY